MTGWTPGPWRFENWGDEIAPALVVVAKQSEAAGFCREVADCSNSPGPEEEQEANATLISAAPCQHERLKETTELLERLCNEPVPTADLDGEIARQIERNRATLAKATGT